MAEEQILVVPTALFRDLGYFQGFSPEIDRYLPRLLEADEDALVEAPVGNRPGPGQHEPQKDGQVVIKGVVMVDEDRCFGCQYQNGNMDIFLPQLPANRQAVFFGQHDIQNN